MKLILGTSLFLIFFSAYGAVYEVLEYSVNVNIESVNYGDSHDSSNEYKLDLRLQSSSGEIVGDSGPMLGVLKASDSNNAYAAFSKYERIKVGETISRNTTVFLPKSVLDQTLLKIVVLEADLTIPVPGPCCLYINQDDREVDAKIDLSEGEQVLQYIGDSAKVTVTIKLVNKEFLSLEKIVRKQQEYLYEDPYFSIGNPRTTNLYLHIIKNI